MSQVNTSIAAVLRRRATQLSGDHDERFVGVFLRAADELEIRKASSAEQEAIDLAAENAQLRKTLRAILEYVREARMARHDREHVEGLILNAWASARGPRRNRRLVAVELVEGWTRETVIAAMVARVNEIAARDAMELAAHAEE